jgi:hypothetical protein
LPEIQQWWQTWWERYGHIRLYTEQTTLVTRDEFTLQELQVALPSMRDAIMGLVTPRVALLQAEDADRIVSHAAWQKAKVSIKERAIELGATHIVWLHNTKESVAAEAYRCPVEGGAR